MADKIIDGSLKVTGGLVDSNNNSISVDNLATLDTAQTFSGVKTFSNGIKIDFAELSYLAGVSSVLIDKNLSPKSNNAYDLGRSALKWRNLYFSGSLRDGKNADYGYTLPDSTALTANKTLATTDDISSAIATVKANTFQDVNTTTYPTLADFLLSTGEEGVIYLYPIDTTDLTKGYYQYIWESAAWRSIGTTQIDLSNYPTLNGNNTFTGDNTFSGKILGAGGVTNLSLENSYGKLYVQPNGFISTTYMIPISNNTYDLGLSNQKWRDLYLSGNLNIGNYAIYSGTNKLIVTTNFLPNTTESYDLGTSSNKWKDLYLSGNIKYDKWSVTEDVSTHLLHFKYENGNKFYMSATALVGASNGAYDLGTSGSFWKDLYLSGQLKDGTNSITVANIQSKVEVKRFI